MADKLNVSIFMKLIDGITAPIKSIQSSISKATKAFEPFQQKAEHAFQAAANMKLANEGIASLAENMRRFAEAPIEEATQFQMAITKVGAQSGLTSEQIQSLGGRVQELATGTEFSSTTVGQSLLSMRRAGLSLTEATAQMPRVMAFATASSLDLGEASSRVSSILKGFKLNAEDTGHATDLLTTTALAAGLPVDSFSESLAQIAPQARAMNVSLESAASVMSLLGKAGLSGETGASALHGIMTRLADPRGRKLREAAFSFLGISAVDAKKNLKDLPTLLGEIQEKTSKMGGLQKQSVIGALFGRETAGSINALFASMKPGAIDELRKAVTTGEGSTEKLAGSMDKTAEVMQKKFHASIANLGTVFGTLLLPSLTSFTEKLTAIVDGVSRWTAAHPKLASALAATFLAVTALLTGMTALVSIVSAAKTIEGVYYLVRGWAAFNAVLLMNPIILVIAGIAALVAAVVFLVRHWELVTGAVERFQKASLGAKIMLGVLVGPLLLILSPLILIAGAIRAVIDHWEEWGRKIDDVVAKMTPLLDNPVFKTLVTEPAKELGNIFSSILDTGSEATGVLTGPQTQKSEHKVRVELAGGLQAKSIESRGDIGGFDFDAGAAMSTP